MILTDEKLLRTPCEDVRPEEVDDLILALEQELDNSAKLGVPGVGLACAQIGISKRAAIVRISEKYQANLINCKIAKYYDYFTFENEGCLSFPGERLNTRRANEIYVVGNSVYPYSFIATGLMSVVIQHELDHLDGILLPDRKIIQIPKQKPNDMCFCGSKKKFKKCCYLRS